MTRRENERGTAQVSWEMRKTGFVLCLSALLAILLGVGLMAAAGTAYAASSAEQKGQEYAQQDPGYQAAEEGSGTTQYFLDIEEPEPEPSPITTTGLPKTGDSAEARTFLLICGGLGVLAIAGLCLAFKPKKRDSDESDSSREEQ